MQRKNNKTRGANAEEKRFHTWLANQRCCVSGDYGVQIHHCKGSSFRHNKVLIGHWFVIPLSPERHAEYHSGTKAFREKYGPQSALWSELVEKYESETGLICPYDVQIAIMNYAQ
ncbi:MAG: DUF968 domain-containing protein [Phaeodactylibacter sp.]|nr:DUF968 domain-containing protein [Phaeodactylibacter sp.]